MRKLLIATANPAKKAMFQELLNESDVILITLDDYPNIIPPEENGHTVKENAYIKAAYYSEKTWLPALSDDAGLCIPSLNNEPGVMARRWGWVLPDTVSDEDWMKHFQDITQDIPEDPLSAILPFARCLYLPDGRYFFQEEEICVHLSKTPRTWWKTWWPMSAFCIYPDGRHQLDVPENDPIQQAFLYKDGLVNLLQHLS